MVPCRLPFIQCNKRNIAILQNYLQALFHQKYLGLFDNYTKVIQRVDFIRGVLLLVFGGIYADLDMEAIKCPWPFLPREKLSLVGSPWRDKEMYSIAPNKLNSKN